MTPDVAAPGWYLSPRGTIRRGVPASTVPHSRLDALDQRHVRPGHTVRFMPGSGEGLYEGLVHHTGELGAVVSVDSGATQFVPYDAVHDVIPPGRVAYGAQHMQAGAPVTCEHEGKPKRGTVLAWGHHGATCELEDGRQTTIPYDTITEVGDPMDLEGPARMPGEAAKVLALGRERTRPVLVPAKGKGKAR